MFPIVILGIALQLTGVKGNGPFCGAVAAVKIHKLTIKRINAFILNTTSSSYTLCGIGFWKKKPRNVEKKNQISIDKTASLFVWDESSEHNS